MPWAKPVKVKPSHTARVCPQTRRMKHRPITTPSANINKTTDANREDEIAAKIASLRKHKRLNSKPPSTTPSSDANAETTTPQSKPQPPPVASTSDAMLQDQSLFSQLPDWKKEEIMQQQIQEAETFFQPPTLPEPQADPDPGPELQTEPDQQPSQDESQTQPQTPDQEYQPKVSTWGVFPRPKNISRQFGGGKKIAPGGVDLKSAESQARDKEIAEKIARYRKGVGTDLQTEQTHSAEITAALTAAENHLNKSRPQTAITELEAVAPYVSDRSRRGGSVLLTLALGYEATGQRASAKALYERLKRSPYPEISSKAKQLLAGFAAMATLRIEDDSSDLRGPDFRLPDLNTMDKRYETAVLPDEAATAAPIPLLTNVILALVMLFPLALLAVLLSLRHA